MQERWGQCGRGCHRRSGSGGANLDVDDRGGRVRGDGDAIDAIEDGAGGSDVVLQRGQDRRRVTQKADTL